MYIVLYLIFFFHYTIYFGPISYHYVERFLLTFHCPIVVYQCSMINLIYYGCWVVSDCLHLQQFCNEETSTELVLH